MRFTKYHALTIFIILSGINLLIISTLPSEQKESMPTLFRLGRLIQLIVDDKPYLILGCELQNYIDSEYINNIFVKLAKMNFNTVLVPVSWDIIEPRQGVYDFNTVDVLIQSARENNMRLILIWLASWNNGSSENVPQWVKADTEKYPCVELKIGWSLNVLSPLSDTNKDADGKAFAALMRHIKEIDSRERTIIMMQIENKPGLAGQTRDRSEAANQAFAGAVPEQLMDHLQMSFEHIWPGLRNLWEKQDMEISGTWQEIFGTGTETDEIFMAWHYAQYIDKIAERGKAQYNIPMFVNARYQQPSSEETNRNLSGGPLPQVFDIWMAGAGNIDFYAPEISLPDFEFYCKSFQHGKNPLFICNDATKAQSAAMAMCAVADYDAMGFWTDGIEELAGADSEIKIEDELLSKCNNTLSQLAPIILEHQDTRTMAGLLQDFDSLSNTLEDSEQVELGDWIFNIQFAPTDRQTHPGGIIIMPGQDEYIITGTGLEISFSPAVSETENVSFISIDEGKFKNGRWIRELQLVADEISQKKSFKVSHFKIYKVKFKSND
jgi:hypothetical protein